MVPQTLLPQGTVQCVNGGEEPFTADLTAACSSKCTSQVCDCVVAGAGTERLEWLGRKKGFL